MQKNPPTNKGPNAKKAVSSIQSKENICISVEGCFVLFHVCHDMFVMERKRKTRSATHEVRNCILIIGIIAEIGDKWRDIVRR